MHGECGLPDVAQVVPLDVAHCDPSEREEASLGELAGFVEEEQVHPSYLTRIRSPSQQRVCRWGLTATGGIVRVRITVGWRERDYARFNESERRVFHAGGRATSRSVAGGFGLAFAVTVSLALVLVGQFPRGHPLVPGLGFRIPGIGSSHSHIATSAAHYGGTETFRGTTSQDGAVEADGSWNGGPWELLATGAAAQHAYMVSFPITNHGTLAVRIKLPGGREADGTVLVP